MMANCNETDPHVQDIIKMFADAGIEIEDFTYKESRGHSWACDYGGELRFTDTACCEWHVQNNDPYCIECLEYRLSKTSPFRSVLRRLKKKIATLQIREKRSQIPMF